MAESHFDTFVRSIGACRDRWGVLGDEGLVYPPREDYGYDATPRNAVTFGAMGVDGVHYAVLRIGGVIDDNSPVIQVAPMDFSDPYSLLAESFLEYLAVGCGVSITEMQRVFDAEHDRGDALVAFLRDHFDQSRLWDEHRDRSMERHRDLLELQP